MSGDNSFGEDSINQAFKRLNRGYDGVFYAGNFIIVYLKPMIRLDRKMLEAEIYEDITLIDFRIGFDLITRYNTIFEAARTNKYVIRNRDAWSKGVKINCAVDIITLHKQNAEKRYQEIYVRHARSNLNQSDDDSARLYFLLNDTSHPAYHSQEISSVCRQMGIELQIMRLPCHVPTGYCFEIGSPFALLMNADPKSKTWGKWIKGHPFIIIRKDKEDISLY